MEQLLLIIVVLSVAVAVPYKARNSTADLPTSVMEGFKGFLSDLKKVVSEIKKVKAKASNDEIDEKTQEILVEDSTEEVTK